MSNSPNDGSSKSQSKLSNRLLPTKSMTAEMVAVELSKIQQQFIIIHDMPKIGDRTPIEYMHESLEGLRSRCIELHWRSIELVKTKYR
jgi:hypothetical protein